MVRLFRLDAKNLDDERNQMRLHFAIEQAFDIKHLTFVGVQSPSASAALTAPLAASSSSSLHYAQSHPRHLFGLRVCVMNPDLKKDPIGDTGKTFGDIDGQEVKFPNTNRPYFRIIYAHYRQSRIFAQERGWITSEVDDDPQKLSDQELLSHSLDTGYRDRIAIWLKSKSGAPASVPQLESEAPEVEVEDKTCVGQGCHNLRYSKCQKKMCGRCCGKFGDLCAKHQRK